MGSRERDKLYHYARGIGGSGESMTEDELALLRSYEKGPRIWDAASIVPAVYALKEKGLIKSEDGYRYQLTGAGRRELEAS